MSIDLYEIRSSIIGENFPIKRALPQKQLRNIGHWVFLDHAGPVRLQADENFDIGAHPHIGLQTFTWMLQGEIIHNDSLGSDQVIRPYQINLMTAGHGITHTELSHPDSCELHLAQLWIALPKDKVDIAPDFKHYDEIPYIQHKDYDLHVLVGQYNDHISPVEMQSDLMALDIVSNKATSITLPLNPKFEYGLLPLEGSCHIDEQIIDPNTVAKISHGKNSITISLEEDSRILLIGGEPLEAPPLIWWNFVAWDQPTIEKALSDWNNHSDRFPPVQYEGKSKPLVAPELIGNLRSH